MDSLNTQFYPRPLFSVPSSTFCILLKRSEALVSGLGFYLGLFIYGLTFDIFFSLKNDFFIVRLGFLLGPFFISFTNGSNPHIDHERQTLQRWIQCGARCRIYSGLAFDDSTTFTLAACACIMTGGFLTRHRKMNPCLANYFGEYVTLWCEWPKIAITHELSEILVSMAISIIFR